MAQIKAKFCAYPGQEWGSYLYLTCDNKIALRFKNHTHSSKGPDGKRHSYGGMPTPEAFLYKTGRQDDTGLYEAALVWGGLGKFLWHVLGYHCPYTIVQPPVMPCLGCACTCTVATSGSPSQQGAAVTFTATVTNTDGSAIPAGTVSFSSDKDGSLGNGTALTSANPATSQLTTTTLSVNTHTITATFTPAAGYQSASGQVQQVVQASGIQTGCCANLIPGNLTLTITGGGALNGSYTLTYNAGTSTWTGSGSVGSCPANSFGLKCTFGNWNLVGPCGVGGFPSSSHCSPFSMSFTNKDLTCCGGNPGTTITITP